MDPVPEVNPVIAFESKINKQINTDGQTAIICNPCSPADRHMYRQPNIKTVTQEVRQEAVAGQQVHV